MSRIVGFIRSEPALVAAVVVAVIQAVALPDVWAKVVMAALSLVAGAGVRTVVTPTATVTATVEPIAPPTPPPAPTAGPPL